MSDPLKLPYALIDYDGLLEVLFRYDDVCRRQVQGADPIDVSGVSDAPVVPLVTFQCKNNRGEKVGPIYAYDYDKESWVIYDKKLNLTPQSKSKSSPVDVGTPSSLDLSSKSTVKMESRSAPERDIPSVRKKKVKVVPSVDDGKVVDEKDVK